MLWDKIDLAFLHMHMEIPCRDLTINIDSMSEAQHWLQWKRLRWETWNFHLECMKVQALIIDLCGDIEGMCWGYVLRPVVIHFSFAIEAGFAFYSDYALYISY